MGRRSSGAPTILGDVFLGPFICHSTDMTPASPDAAPEYEIRSAAGLDSGTPLVTGTATAISGVTGGYYLGQTLNASDGFAAGENYVVIIDYLVSAVTYTDIIDLPVV